MKMYATKTNHTPGPWAIEENEKSGVLFSVKNGATVCRWDYKRGPVEEDARLIAAAPDLLAAAKQIMWKLSFEHSPSGKGGDCHHARIDRDDATVQMLCAAIAQAEGRGV